MMAKMAIKEIEVLTELQRKRIPSKSDPDNKKKDEQHTRGRHACVKMIEHFIYKEHTCLVFEFVDMSLRGCIKKYSNQDGKRGLSLAVCQRYSKQLMWGLRHMHR
jgi:serine/threonine-protein kinase PRP4